ncbi:hypothetical protein TRFO_32509 [Tritrichomonas foetus]|uniref:Peptidase C1A papain C-terminal domain-containing protein n=1 Tax=Tritrichomonas foetus TaxID=1144522 RepID=A0A1J4JQP2_9EUKA|nr:hypothetical protein TRFO_32509 [Tritrichomonas foetus]|eukprot:OHT00728.1 hypothetical protein TRFO_32509 [Tritrichomonas foetus]
MHDFSPRRIGILQEKFMVLSTIVFAGSMIITIHLLYQYFEYFALAGSEIFTEDFPFDGRQNVPKYFSVDTNFLLPTSNQYDRGTCWAFTAISLLESQYKYQGIMNDFLLDDEYVAFSVEAMMSVMTNLCLNNPNTSACLSSLRSKNTTNGGYPEELVTFSISFPEFRKSILPKSTCEYSMNEMNNINYSILRESIKKNPLEFSIKSVSSKQGVFNIKRFLFEKHRPLSFTLPLPEQIYYFPCSNSQILHQYNEICSNNLIKCPKTDEYCVPIHFGLDKTAFSDLIFSSNKNTFAGTGHAVVLVGYNDNFVVRKKLFNDSQKMLKGGFIAKNSWGDKGHSLEYLMGEISDDQERLICPNKDSVMNWNPANLSCINKTRDPSLCSKDISIIDGNQTTFGAHTLICINESHCEINHTYVLMRESKKLHTPVVSLSLNDVPIATLIKFTKNLSKNPEIINITTLPYHHLYYAFKKLEKVNQISSNEHSNKISQNIQNRCGYLFIPYDTINELYKLRGIDTCDIIATDIEIEWTPESYAFSGSSKDYSEVLRSTGYYDKVYADSPFQNMFNYDDLML